MSRRIQPGSRRDVGLFTWLLAQTSGLVGGTRAPQLFLVLGKHRRLFHGWLAFASRLMPRGSLPRRETELAILRVAHLRGSDYEFAQHRRIGRRVGIRDEDVDRIVAGPDTTGWSERERAMLTAIDQLQSNRDLDDDTWLTLRRHLDEREAIELCLLVGHYDMLATVIATLRIPPDQPRRQRHKRAGLMSLLALTAAFAVATVSASPVRAAPPHATPVFESGFGITVEGVHRVGVRQYVVDISTAEVVESAIRGPNQVRILLPTNYRRTGVRYPVLYLLHGGGNVRSDQWVNGGDVVDITSGKPLITVMPDGGKVGWYTNWVNPGRHTQNWPRFHLRQLRPWIEANLRTIDDKAGRAIAGLSMGGFGAIRYAQRRPDLFAYAASFSGALNLGAPGIRAVIVEESTRLLGKPFGPFGSPLWWTDEGFVRHNPLHHVDRLRGVEVALYSGSGFWPGHFIERAVGASTKRMHHALNVADIPHHFEMYGSPALGELSYNCDGGHNFSCWNYALQDVLPTMLNVLRHPPVNSESANKPPAPQGVGHE